MSFSLTCLFVRVFFFFMILFSLLSSLLRPYVKLIDTVGVCVCVRAEKSKIQVDREKKTQEQVKVTSSFSFSFSFSFSSSRLLLWLLCCWASLSGRQGNDPSLVSLSVKLVCDRVERRRRRRKRKRSSPPFAPTTAVMRLCLFNLFLLLPLLVAVLLPQFHHRSDNFAR